MLYIFQNLPGEQVPRTRSFGACDWSPSKYNLTTALEGKGTK